MKISPTIAGKRQTWKATALDAALVETVALLAEQFGKPSKTDAAVRRLTRQDLELICFDHVSA